MKKYFYIIMTIFLTAGVVFAVGFHPSSEILPGTFQGDYKFNGSINSTGNISSQKLDVKENVSIGGSVDMQGGEIKNVGEIRDIKTNYELLTWGGYAPQSSGDKTMGPYSASSGNSHYIEKLQFSSYHPYWSAYVRNADTGEVIAQRMHCDNWGNNGGERGDSCVFEFPYPLEINSSTNWEFYIEDWDNNANIRVSTTAYGFEAKPNLYPKRQGIMRGGRNYCSADSWCSLKSYTVPNDKVLKLTGMGFSTRHTYSILRIEDNNGDIIINGHTLGSHEWGNTNINFGRAKTIQNGTSINLMMYNDDGTSRRSYGDFIGYLKDK